MDPVLEKLVEIKRWGRAAALAVVIGTEGSTPRKAGAKMIVCQDGSVIGTLGGGDLERAVIKEALDAIHEERPRTASFTLDRENGLDMMCGGKVEVYIEPLLPPEKLIIFGAGHITRSLAPMMEKLGFLVTVVDDNPDYLKTEYFSEIKDLRIEDMESFAKGLPSDNKTYILLLSRGFSRDKAILRNLIGKEFKYIGMIGSRRKLENIKHELKEEGITEDVFEKLKSPMGLNIGAETPEEIAISIAAEIISVRKGRPVVVGQ